MDARDLAGILVVATASAGCLGPELTFAGAGGGGGEAATSTTVGGGGAPATTSTGGGGAAATTSTGGGGDAATTSTGGGPECGDPDDCDPPGDPCFAPKCDDGVCGEVPAPIDAPCLLAGQLPGVCDGEGLCVECTVDAQCVGTDTCDEDLGACVPRCANGEQDGDETDVDCGGSCEARCGAGLGCIDGSDCESNVCESATTCANGKAVFVTSDWVRPDFGGALGGDEICQQFATAAGLSGTFMAWLSDSTTTPSVRFVPSAVPYLRLDGVVVAGDWAELTSGFLRVGIDIDDLGVEKPFSEVWTATNVDGTLLEPTCLEWTSQDAEPTGFAGLTSTTDERWTLVYTQFCNRSGVRLYCFQQ